MPAHVGRRPCGCGDPQARTLSRQSAQQLGKRLQVRRPRRCVAPIQRNFAPADLARQPGQHNMRHGGQPLVRQRRHQRVAAAQAHQRRQAFQTDILHMAVRGTGRRECRRRGFQPSAWLRLDRVARSPAACVQPTHDRRATSASHGSKNNGTHADAAGRRTVGGASTASSSPSRRRRNRPRGLPSEMLSRAPGKCCGNGVIRCGSRYGPSDAGTPSRNSPPNATAAGAGHLLQLFGRQPARRRSAATAVAPPAVGTMLRPPRSNNGEPSACSTFCT